ncbi:MAG: hypothetical protein EOO77_18410 [Oxalobacteraceae bacterium]|nr:MAG: hypothetical protein EOO77_18410 [Oxalobacteraceae bacterium]
MKRMESAERTLAVSSNQYANSPASLPWREEAVVIYSSQTATGSERKQVFAGTLYGAVEWVIKKSKANRASFTIHLPERRKPPLSYASTEFEALSNAHKLLASEHMATDTRLA